VSGTRFGGQNVHCNFTPHAGEFPDDEFWLRDDGEWVHEFDPLHTAKGRLIFDTPDAAEPSPPDKPADRDD
jgi:hypothetical protein